MDAPPAKGKSIVMIAFVNANLVHDDITGRLMMASMHILNKTPIDYYSKRQTTVETATYGSEFVVTRTTTEQIMDLRATLQFLGANVW